jgi:hypothetical protein
LWDGRSLVHDLDFVSRFTAAGSQECEYENKCEFI